MKNLQSYSDRISAARAKAVNECADILNIGWPDQSDVQRTLRAIAQRVEFRPYNVASPNNIQRALVEIRRRRTGK